MSVFCPAQKIIPIEGHTLENVTDAFLDDYGGVYLYNSKNFSLTKYNEEGEERDEILVTFPFKVQSVNNPLSIIAFSENMQQIEFLDQNLNQIQQIPLSSVGYANMGYAENLQSIWVINESNKQLYKYNFRDGSIYAHYYLDIPLGNLKDMLVYSDKVFLLIDDRLLVYHYHTGKKVSEASVPLAKKIRREGREIFVISREAVYQYGVMSVKKVFVKANARIVEKNNSNYLALIDNKLYLYPIKTNNN
ncbi:hypothetical protein [Riemerella columbipharyngis]|nr:hypothetical protein [Riemerella columbipharyngis]